MATEALTYNHVTTVTKVGATNYDSRIESVDSSSAKTLLFSDKRRFNILASASAIDIFPTGIPALANDNLEFEIVHEFSTGASLTAQYLTYAVDAASFSARGGARFSAGTSVTVSNPDASNAVTIEVLTYVRLA